MDKFDINIHVDRDHLKEAGLPMDLVVVMIETMAVRCTFNPYYQGIDQQIYFFNVLESVSMKINTVVKDNKSDVYFTFGQLIDYDNMFEMTHSFLIDSFIGARLSYDNKENLIQDLKLDDLLWIQIAKKNLLQQSIHTN